MKNLKRCRNEKKVILTIKMTQDEINNDLKNKQNSSKIDFKSQKIVLKKIEQNLNTILSEIDEVIIIFNY